MTQTKKGRRKQLPSRVFGSQRSSLKTYGVITIACVVVSVVFHFVTTGLSKVSDLSQQMLNQAAASAIDDKIQELTDR
ncbi:MAG: hypothetical protein CME15_00875 [Gemmatimonadetes bacterium]|jgi:hypothetical protein|nr:hypothetical protein [Gemmatimonadota bacterium]